jgi:hypothetical protein
VVSLQVVDSTVSSDIRHAGSERTDAGANGTPASLDRSTAATGHDDASSRDVDPPSRDDVFEVLTNQRRRYALHCLHQRDERVELGDLAETIGARENDTTIPDLTSTERKRTYTSLQQFHLPKMDEAGLLDCDRRAGVVSCSEPASDLDVYLDVVPASEIPWSLHYLGLSVLNVVLVVGLWFDAYPLAVLPDLVWIACAVTAFVASAAVHTYRNRRMRLGAEDTPPDLPSR